MLADILATATTSDKAWSVVYEVVISSEDFDKSDVCKNATPTNTYGSGYGFNFYRREEAEAFHDLAFKHKLRVYKLYL